MNFAKGAATASLAVALAGSCLAESRLLIGQGKAGDWQSDAPGVQHRITIEGLPPDYATPSVNNGPKVVARPEGAKPDVPVGFNVSLFASGLERPRYLLTAPNGDIFVAEGYAGRIRVLRDTDGDGRPEITQTFASGLRQPFGLAFYPPGPSPEYLYVPTPMKSCAFHTATAISRRETGPYTSLISLRGED